MHCAVVFVIGLDTPIGMSHHEVKLVGPGVSVRHVART